MRAILLAAAAVLPFAVPAVAQQGGVFFCDVASPSAIWDGDTWRCRDGTRIRLQGANTLERGEPGWRASRDFLRDLIGGKLLACKAMGVSISFDKPRINSQCTLPTGEDVAAEIVKAGLAWDCPKYSGGTYAALEGPEHPEPSDGTRRMCGR